MRVAGYNYEERCADAENDMRSLELELGQIQADNALETANHERMKSHYVGLNEKSAEMNKLIAAQRQQSQVHIKRNKKTHAATQEIEEKN